MSWGRAASGGGQLGAVGWAASGGGQLGALGWPPADQPTSQRPA